MSSADSHSSLRKMLTSPVAIITLLVSAWFIIAFLITPNLTILKQIFMPQGEFSFTVWERLSRSERAKRALLNSFLLGVTLSITVNIVGTFIVLVTQYFKVYGARILWLVYASPLVYGGVVLVAGYKFLYGSSGIFTKSLMQIFPSMNEEWFIGFWPVVFVMTFSMTGNHLLFLSSAIAKIDYSTIEAARQLGASQWTILRTVVFPTLKPTLFSLTILKFLGGLGAFVVPLMLGGRQFPTIAPMILSFSQSATSRDLAAALAILLALATLIMLAWLNYLERNGTYFSVSKVPSILQKQKIENPFANIMVHALAYLLFLIYLLPPLFIIVFSFTDAATISSGQITLSSFTLENYATILRDAKAYQPFLVSVAYSAVASIAVVGGMLFVARIITQYRNSLSQWLEYLFHIPWIMPGALLSLGLIVSFDHPNPLVGGRVLTGTVILLGLAYIITKIPFTLRMIKASFMSIHSSLEEAASLLGASQLTIFRRVLFPIVAPSALAIAALNFNALLDNYDMAVFLSHPFYQPLGIFIKNATEGERSGDTIALTFVYAVILMVIAMLILYLVYGRGTKAVKG